MTAGSGEVVLALRDVSKSFGPVVALRSGRIEARAGSIHALVGENGAGKSTLVKIVAGVHRRDAGEFLLGGEEVDFGSTAESKDAGVAVIYQEPTLFPDLSVTEIAFQTGWKSLGTFGRTFRDVTGESPGELRAREKSAAQALDRVPACILSAASRPGLTIAVSEKRRQDAEAMTEPQETESP